MYRWKTLSKGSRGTKDILPHDHDLPQRIETTLQASWKAATGTPTFSSFLSQLLNFTLFLRYPYTKLQQTHDERVVNVFDRGVLGLLVLGKNGIEGERRGKGLIRIMGLREKIGRAHV